METKTVKNSQTKMIIGRLFKNKAAVIGLVIVSLEILIAVLAPLIIPYDYAEINIMNAKAFPSIQHLMGTDELGRDIFSRLIYGARYSLTIGFVATACAAMGGLLIGSVVGYFGGTVDNMIMRTLDIIQAMPPILLQVCVATTLGTGFTNTVIALSLVGIPGYVRLMRGSVMSIRSVEYLESAESINCSKLRIIFRHVVPNAFAPMIVAITMGVADIILTVAGLSFIGLGVPQPTPEWGAMLSASRNYIRTSAHMVMFPGIAIAITVLALNLLGDGLRDALDPKLKD